MRERLVHIHGWDNDAQKTVVLHSVNLDLVEYLQWSYQTTCDPPVTV